MHTYLLVQQCRLKIQTLKQLQSAFNVYYFITVIPTPAPANSYASEVFCDQNGCKYAGITVM